MIIQLTHPYPARIGKSAFLLRLNDPVRVFFPVYKIERICRYNIICNLFKLSIVKQNIEILLAADPEVIATQGINPVDIVKFSFVNRVNGHRNLNTDTFL